jgi:acyl-CoA synthetase (AMP-forming)/AMP-acid ligase II
LQLPEFDYPATIPGVVRHAAAEFGDRDFIIMPDERMTFAEAESASRRIGKALLAAGAGKGTRVGMTYPQGADWIVVWLAIARIGAVCMPFSSAYKPAELRKALRFGDVDTLVVPSTFAGADHLAYIEEAVPGLAGAGAAALRIVELPYLRQVLVSGKTTRAWAHPLAVGFRESVDRSGVDDAFFEAVESQVTPSDLMITVFTSGTTSEPKGVVHTHGNFVRHGINLARFQGVTPDYRVFGGMPFFWIGGVGLVVNGALAVGHPIICMEEFDIAGALDLMEREQSTLLGMWSQLAQKVRHQVVASGRDVSRIPAFAPPPPGTPTTNDPELRHNSLGMTETVGPHSGPGPDGGRILPEEMRGSFGLLVPYVEHRIADPVTNETLGEGTEGEVCIRGYSLMHGLYKKERSETFDDDGWYHTGDKGTIRDGYLYFHGRLTEMIKTSGSNVAPREVELTFEQFPEVGLAVVLGLPDPERGQVVGAVVLPRPGARVDPLDVVDRARKELSSYKVPRRVLVLADDELPQLASGKPDKLRLRELLAERGVDVRHR